MKRAKYRPQAGQDGAQPQSAKPAKARDSFQNFQHRLGIGTDSPLSSSTYGFNPITRERVKLEWIHRGSWLGGVAVDVVADDMTRAGVQIHGELEPGQIEELEEHAVALGVWPALNDTIKWSRLYGGAVAVMLVDGQDQSTPLKIDTIGRGQFKGMLVLDRWMVEPSLNDLVEDFGPNLGMPKFYTVTSDAPGLRGKRIHHSRCFRLEGVRLPYYQRIGENLWGLSVLERLYDRMVAFDSATTGAAQLVYKSYLRTIKIQGLRDIVSAGGDAMNGLANYVDMMRRFQGIEGLTMLDAEDTFEVQQHSAFSGLSDALTQFGQQLSGALQIPLVRLFGQSPSGFNSGDSDLRNYYDSIKQQQERTMRVPLTKLYRIMARSEGIELPDGFRLEFKSLWQLSDTEKATIAQTTTQAVLQAEESGVISRKIAMQELKQSAQVTGIYSNITPEDLEEAENDPPPGGESLIPGQGEPNGADAGQRGDTQGQAEGEGQIRGIPTN